MDSSTALTLACLLIALSFLFLLAELFLPTGGVLFALALAGLVVGVTFAFLSGTTAGIVTLITVFFLLPAALGFMFYWWPKTTMGKRFFLTGPQEDATVASLPANKELELLRGRFGRALSVLRPAGVVDFDGRRVDSITEGIMVEPGEWVRCIDVQAGKVIVRPVEKPNLDNLETANFG